MTRDAAHFDRWYQDLADSPAADEIAQRVLGLPARLQSSSLLGWDAFEEVVAALGVVDGQVLLDLACGRGGYGLEIARRSGVRVVGVDFSAVAIGQARRRADASGLADRAEFRVGELTRTGLAAGSVDAVLVVDAVQFAEPLPQALREVRRVLVPGGRLVMTCWEVVDPADERLPEALRRLDLARRLPLAGFADVEVADRPAWREVERALWQEAVTIAPGDDPTLRSLRNEGLRKLDTFDAIRRVLVTARAPGRAGHRAATVRTPATRPTRTTTDRTRLRAGAAAVLDANWLGASTVPSRRLYPNQWNWDSALVAFGLRHLDIGRARQEISTLLAAQWDSGLVPHIVFDAATAHADYHPNAAFWASRTAPGSPAAETSGLTQPPVAAPAALAVYRHDDAAAASRDWLREIYPKLVAYQRYLTQRRDLGGRGLVGIVHPWESLDNSPAWDEALAAVPVPADLETYTRHDLRHAPAAHRPTRGEYDRYVHLVALRRAAGYTGTGLADHPFVVEDPLFNAIVVWAAHALAEIATVLDEDPAPHRAAAARVREAMMARLWDPAADLFRAWDVRTGTPVAADTVAGFMPLLDPDLPDHAVRGLVRSLRQPRFWPQDGFPVASQAMDTPAFDAARYWRGPAWVNTNWLIWTGLRTHGRHALAADLAATTLDMVRRGGWREYFDPITGEGLGATDFSWTAALTVDLLDA